jgi:hypothetical protein
MRRRKLLVPFAIVVGVVGGAVTVSVGSSNDVQPAREGEDSYSLSDFSVMYPLVMPLSGEVREGVAGVSMQARAASNRYAGDVRCELTVLGVDGAEVGRSEFWLGFDGEGPLAVGPIGVPVTGTPSTADGVCEASRPVDSNAGYDFSNLETVLEPNPALVGDIAWRTDTQPGEHQCFARLDLGGTIEEVPFSIAQSQGHGVITLLSEKMAGGEPIGVSCHPMVGQPLS